VSVDSLVSCHEAGGGVGNPGPMYVRGTGAPGSNR
jgi:hypothetical protein